MNKPFFDPVIKTKKDATFVLYSLKGWNFKEWTVAKMPTSTPIGEAISRINQTALKCFYSFSFFRYCREAAQDKNLYAYATEELPKKCWLRKLSADKEELNKSVETFFDNQTSLLDCIKGWDVNRGYAMMQYLEGYYLIQESVKNALLKGEKKIEVAFLLPRGEEKYYTYREENHSFAEFRKDVEKMLRLQFQEKLRGIEVNISFLFFQYGEGTKYRPYQNTYSPVIKERELMKYF